MEKVLTRKEGVHPPSENPILGVAIITRINGGWIYTVKLGIRFTALLGSSRLSPNFIMQRWLFVRQSTQKVAKWRFCRKQGSKRRISLKIDIDAQFGYINYPYSIDPHSDTYRAEQGLSRHVASRRDNLFGKNNIKN